MQFSLSMKCKPKAVGVEATNMCPNNCPYCARRTVMKRRPAYMTPEEAEKIARSIPHDNAWAEFGFVGEPTAHERLKDVIGGFVAGGFRRIQVYTSLICPDGRIADIIDLSRDGRIEDFRVATAPHYWQMTEDAGVVLGPRGRIRRWVANVRVLASAGVHVRSFGCVPWANRINPANKWTRVLTGLPDSRRTPHALPFEMFTAYGLSPRTEYLADPAPCQVRHPNITAEGMLAWCCRDFAPTVTFGSVLHEGFDTCYERKLALLRKMKETRAAWPPICRSCRSASSLASQLARDFA